MFLTQNITASVQPDRNSELFHWSLLENTVVVVVTVYMSIALRNNMHFVCIATVARVDTP